MVTSKNILHEWSLTKLLHKWSLLNIKIVLTKVLHKWSFFQKNWKILSFKHFSYKIQCYNVIVCVGFSYHIN